MVTGLGVCAQVSHRDRKLIYWNGVSCRDVVRMEMYATVLVVNGRFLSYPIFLSKIVVAGFHKLIICLMGLWKDM
jgi:hypothetical protein